MVVFLLRPPSRRSQVDGQQTRRGVGERLGARLIQRTSRSFSLTNLGRDFFQHAGASVIEAEMAETSVRTRLGEPSGTVRLTAAVPTAQFMLADLLAGISTRYPKLRLSLHVTDRFVDIVQEGFDIAVRSHQTDLPDYNSAATKALHTRTSSVVASPGYIETRRAGLPNTPDELSEHRTISAGFDEAPWRLVSSAGDAISVSPKSAIAADEPLVIMKAAVAGLGITVLPTSVCRVALADGSLVRVLPDWTAGSITTTILMPHRRGQLPAVRAVVNFSSNSWIGTLRLPREKDHAALAT